MKNDHPEQLPKARSEQLIVKELDNETLIYDLADDKAHCLNKTAAQVWKNCSGERSVSEIQASLADEAGAPVDEGVVWLALDQLKQFKLLADVPTAPAVFAGMSRRQLIRTLGVAAVALPVIVSLASPTAHAQASCITSGNICTPAGTPCCPGLTCSPSTPPGTKRCQ
jgi:hypothetical protein